jgi:O-antigen/teichoic acid export membrane protein
MKNRTEIILQQIGFSSIYKGLSVVISFLLVPLSITFLGVENYGLWLTIFSFISWFTFFDFGIGNGLRNKLSQALAINDRVLAKQLVSTAYFIMLVVILILIALFLSVSNFVDWNGIFKYTGNENLNKLFQIAFVVFAINLVLKMVTSVFFADQKPSFSGFIHFISQLIVLIAVYIIMQSEHVSLLSYTMIIFFSQFAVLFLSNIFVFQNKFTFMAPHISSVRIKHCKDIFNLGFGFFIIQMCVVIIYSTDNFIINFFLGAEQVTIYNVALKYFMILTMFMNIILTPYWSAFTNAFELKDYNWIKNSFNKLTTFSFIVGSFVIIMVLFSEQMYYFWIGDAVSVPFILSICIGASTFVKVFNLNSIMLINGFGKIRMQLIIGVLSAIINIPLSIILAVNCNLGVSGVIIATLIGEIISVFFYRIQAQRLINRSAKGIFNI